MFYKVHLHYRVLWILSTLSKKFFQISPSRGISVSDGIFYVTAQCFYSSFGLPYVWVVVGPILNYFSVYIFCKLRSTISEVLSRGWERFGSD